MKKNVGLLDMILRIVIGAAVIAIGICYKSWWGALGAVPLLTGIFRRCPLYPLFGINTGCSQCKAGQEEKK